MGRATGLFLALALVAAACGTGSVDESAGSTTTTSQVTTTSTAEPPTTTSSTASDPCPGEPFVIEESGGRLMQGCEYRTDTFGVPISISVTDATWLNLPVQDERVTSLAFDEDGDGDSEAKLVFLIYGTGPEPADVTQEVIAEVDAWAASYEVSEPRTTFVGGHEAVVIDFDTGEELGIDPERDECTPGGLIEADQQQWIFQLVQVVIRSPRQYGIPACKLSRVWVVNVDDTMVTIVAAVRDDARFEELMPIFEDFLASSVTFGDANG